jgi:hypothetical protein
MLHGINNIKRISFFLPENYPEFKEWKCCVWSVVFYGAQTWTVREVDQKHLESLKCGAGEGWR